MARRDSPALSEGMDMENIPFQITIGQLNRFIDEHPKIKACSACGCDDYDVAVRQGEDTESPEAVAQMAALPAAGMNGNLLMHTLICRNCGLVRSHSAQFVFEWIKENE